MDQIKKQVVTEPPTLTGSAGRAWGIPVSKIAAKLGDTNHGEVASWVVEADWAHPFWSHYFILAVHLRDIPGGRKAMVRKTGATHEFFVIVADPDGDLDATIRGEAPCRWLSPINFSAQFIAIDDAHARAFVRREIVEPIINGKLNPDTDASGQWIGRFGADSDGIKDGTLQ